MTASCSIRYPRPSLRCLCCDLGIPRLNQVLGKNVGIGIHSCAVITVTSIIYMVVGVVTNVDTDNPRVYAGVVMKRMT